MDYVASNICPALPGDDDHPELAHELQVIANHYSMFNRHKEAVKYLKRALVINRKRKDPKAGPGRWCSPCPSMSFGCH